MSLDVYLKLPDGESLWVATCTHNLIKIAHKVDLYGVLWNPDHHGIRYARQAIPILEAGLSALKEQGPEWARRFEPANGWGTCEDLIAFAEAVLNACRNFPDAELEALG